MADNVILYHGGNLVPVNVGAEGLWATDDIQAAKDYATTAAMRSADQVAYVHQVEVAGRIVALRDVVDAALADRVEAGDPAALAYAGIASGLADQGVAAVLVETGDEHPDTGREHRSWWIVGDHTTEQVMEIEA